MTSKAPRQDSRKSGGRRSPRHTTVRADGPRRSHKDGPFWNGWRISALVAWLESGAPTPPWGGPKSKRKIIAAPQPFEERRLRAAWQGIMRNRAMLDWRGGQTGLDMTQSAAKRRVLLWLILGEEILARDVESALVQDLPLDKAEISALRALEGQPFAHKAMPSAVRANLPDFLHDRLAARFGARLQDEMAAMNAAAPPVDLRVNPLRVSPVEGRKRLETEGLRPRPMPLAPHGVRLPPLTDIGAAPALHDGWVEVQDEGSQIAAHLLGVESGQLVIDLCAGAGGKTLAIAAAMKNHGRLIALDTSPERLARAKSRLRRAGVHNAELRPAPDGKWIKRQAGRADRVLIDAPCSGSGSWRRKPEGRWAFDPAALGELTRTQAELLDQAARLPKIGGRILYVTCSWLIEENEDAAEGFLRRHANFKRIDLAALWPDLFSAPCPFDGPDMLLTPLRHGTDGFYAAGFERIS